MTYVLCLCFLLVSGMAALMYQVSWVRLLGLSMGSSSASVATVLAAFFLGMSLGSYLARNVSRLSRISLKPYVILELLIGVAGLCSLPLLLNLDVFMAMFPQWGSLLGFKFLVAMVILTVPSICIGATFPVMANILIRNRGELGVRFGELYSLNTVGAVLGALLSGFVFIPALGLDGAIYLAAACNFGVAVTAGWLAWRIRADHPEQSTREEAVSVPVAPDLEDQPETGRETRWSQRMALALLFCTGFVSIGAEVGFTKYASIFAGTTIYGFSAILSIFLAGIAIGSWLVKPYIDSVGRPAIWVATLLLLTAGALIASRTLLSFLPLVNLWLLDHSFGALASRAIRYGAIFAALFLPTVLFGALFPFNYRLYCNSIQRLRRKAGPAYAINTLGGILGSLVAGFLVIPYFGTDTLLVGLSLLLLLFSVGIGSVFSNVRSQVVFTSIAGGLIALVFLLPGINYRNLLVSIWKGAPETHAFRYLKEGKSAVVALTEDGSGYVSLSNNGLVESRILARDPRFGALDGILLGAIPYLLHEDPKTAFQVGFGGGVTTSTLTFTDLASVNVVELEPAIVDAVQNLHGGMIAAVKDPRVTLTVNDARNTLLLDPARYDLIISQPSHPWVAGASSVFSKEFYALAGSRLEPGGIFVHWVNLFRMDGATLASILKSFFHVYPHGMVFGKPDASGSLYMVGSFQPIEPDLHRIEARLNGPEVENGPLPGLLRQPVDLFRYFLLTRPEALSLAGDAPENTDRNLLSEIRLAAVGGTTPSGDDAIARVLANVHFNLLPWLGETPQNELIRFGHYYLQDGLFGLMAPLERRLTELDPDAARLLTHKRMLMEYRLEQAGKLYREHKTWPDSNRLHHATTLTVMGQHAAAAKVIEMIEEPPIRSLAIAQSLFFQERWADLAVRKPLSPQEMSWQLLGVAKTNPKAAAPLMASLAARFPSVIGIPQLRFLVAVEQMRPELLPKGFRAGSELHRKVQQKLDVLYPLADDAITAREQERLSSIIYRIEWLLTSEQTKRFQQLKHRAAEAGLATDFS